MTNCGWVDRRFAVVTPAPISTAWVGKETVGRSDSEKSPLSNGSRNRAWRLTLIIVGLLIGFGDPAQGAAKGAEPHPLLGVMSEELKRSMEKLVTPEGDRPYFLQYTITDKKDFNVSATLGALTFDQTDHSRFLDVDIRVGDYTLDNTRQIRGEGGGDSYHYSGNWASLPLNDDPLATRQNLWYLTDSEFKAAVERLAQVKANLKVKVEEEDKADDFSREKPVDYVGAWQVAELDRANWGERLKRLSARLRSQPLIYQSGVSLTGQVVNRLVVNSEGTRLQSGRSWFRVGVQVATIAEDGMELWQYASFDAHSPAGLPDNSAIEKTIDQAVGEVLALRDAPIVEPYTGPAILMNRATGVFFHEIFGHRIEGHRQKDVEEGQTFAKKIGQEVLPTFLSIVDDPSRRVFKDVELNGYYEFDDEAVPAQPARLVENGVLKTFLMSRSPTRGINQSNGHGRREPGNRVVARQGNLFIESSPKVQVPFNRLREMLIEECKKQGKPSGLLFKDISGGFTTTQRWTPQAFKVLPILVYRVFVDGKPDELVRGVDIVGTPLTCFSKIIATGDDPDVFNGVCGAESGDVPVSAVSPSVLVQQIEVEKKQKSHDRPPILPAPIAKEAN